MFSFVNAMCVYVFTSSGPYLVQRSDRSVVGASDPLRQAALGPQ